MGGHRASAVVVVVSLASGWTAPVRAQGTVGGLTCEARDRAALLRFTVAPVVSDDAVRCFYGYDGATLDRRTEQVSAAAANAGLRQCAMYDLEPDRDVFVGPETSDATATSWSARRTCPRACTNCSPSDAAFFGDDGSGGSGCDCRVAGGPPSVHTRVEDLDPTPDAPVHTGLDAPPRVTGGSYVVAADCSDLDAQKADAEADAGDGDVVELLLPAGVPCAVRGFELAPIPNDGWVIVRSSADPRLLPPDGALTDRTYAPYVGVLTWSEMGGWGYGDPLIRGVDGARGYYFENVEIGPPALDSPILAPVELPIASIDVATDTITVASTARLLQSVPGTQGSGEIVVLDLAGTSVRGGYGPMHACHNTATTFQLYTGVTNKGCYGGTLVDLTGSSCSGDCGTVSRFVSLPIEAWTDCGGNQCLTIPGHGIPNFPDVAITSGTTSTLSVLGTPAEYQIENDSVVHIEGTGRPSCDGLRNAAVMGDVLTVSRDGQETDCTGVTSGTVHRHRAVSILGTNLDELGDFEPRAFDVERVDADTLELLETPARAGASGGRLFWDVESIGAVVSLAKDSRAEGVRDVVFDRVVSRSCMPWLSQGWASFANSQHVSIVNSYLEHCLWQRVNPVNGRIERIHGIGTSPATLFAGAEDFTVDNDHLWPQWFLFADEDGSGPDTEVDDLSILRTYLWKPDWATRGTAEWRDHFFNVAFPIELKSGGARAAIRGNYFRGWLSNFQQTQPAIQLSLNGSRSAFPNGFHDHAIEDNVFDRGATMLQVSNDFHGIRTADRRFHLTENIRVAGNLVAHIDTVRYTGADGNASGQMVSLAAGVRDFVIERNTYAPERCLSCKLLDTGGIRSSGMRVRDNIFVISTGSNPGRIGFAAPVPGPMLPPLTERGGMAAFREMFWRGLATDVGRTSEWSGNVAIPGIRTSNEGVYAVRSTSADPADALCRSALENDEQLLGLPFTWVGTAASPCDESLAARMDTVFEPGTFAPRAEYADSGADIEALGDAAGLPAAVTVTTTGGGGGFDVAFHAPTTTGCTVDVAPWAGSWRESWDDAAVIERATAGDGSQSQRVEVTGLDPGTSYAYRIFCRKTAIGVVTTRDGAGPSGAPGR